MSAEQAYQKTQSTADREVAIATDFLDFATDELRMAAEHWHGSSTLDAITHANIAAAHLMAFVGMLAPGSPPVELPLRTTAPDGVVDDMRFSALIVGVFIGAIGLAVLYGVARLIFGG